MISLHEPHFEEADFTYLTDALRSNWVSTGGPFVDQFERDFARFVGRHYAISTCNGTVAIQLMLETLRREIGIKGEFDVIVPNLSFIATANAVVHAGGRPIFADCSPGSMNLSAESVASVLQHYHRNPQGLWLSPANRPLLAILPAHIMGWTGEMQALGSMANDHGIPLLEDAAESLGSKMEDGRPAGRIGLASAFSFNGNKILTTGGGGMIVTDDEGFAKRAKHLSTTAKTDSLRYLHDEVGYNFRMVNLLAAIGVSQLQRMPETLVRKEEIYQFYHGLVQSELPDTVSLYREKVGQPNHWLVNLVFKHPADREKALKGLNKDGVGARPLWAPFHLQEALSLYDQPLREWPHAVWIWERALSLPSSSHIKESEIERVVLTIKSALRGQ